MASDRSLAVWTELVMLLELTPVFPNWLLHWCDQRPGLLDLVNLTDHPSQLHSEPCFPL